MDRNILDSAQKVSIDILGDFGGTVADLKKIATELEEKYGADAYIQMDAGYNNISCYLTTPQMMQDEIERQQTIKEEQDKKKQEKEQREYQRLKKKFG